MRKTAITILLAGLVFVYFNITFAGVDILIDAVGWLVIWNAVRALQKLDRVYLLAPYAAFTLVIISVFTMFASAGALKAAYVLQGAVELVFWFMLFYGFFKLATKAGGFAFKLITAAGVVGAAVPPVLLILANTIGSNWMNSSISRLLIYSLHVLVMVCFVTLRTMLGKLDAAKQV